MDKSAKCNFEDMKTKEEMKLSELGKENSRLENDAIEKECHWHLFAMNARRRIKKTIVDAHNPSYEGWESFKEEWGSKVFVPLAILVTGSEGDQEVIAPC
ncbi:hypothetical protein GOBAR_DD02028 [Gossypium barbadense]|nr:hypothetical protein GOBAR_DD02028 [Gossypium barbadense]